MVLQLSQIDSSMFATLAAGIPSELSHVLAAMIGGVLVIFGDRIRDRSHHRRDKRLRLVNAFADMAAATVERQHACLRWHTEVLPEVRIPPEPAIHDRLATSKAQLEVMFARYSLHDPDRSRVLQVQAIIREDPFNTAVMEHPYDRVKRGARLVALSQTQGSRLASIGESIAKWVNG